MLDYVERLNESRIIARAQSSVITDALGARASLFVRKSLHAPHGSALFVGLDADVTVLPRDGAAVRGRVLLVPPDLTYAVEAPGPTLEVLYDPERARGLAEFARARGCFPLLGKQAARLVAAAFAHRTALARGDVLAGVAHEAFNRLELAAPRRHLDRRVARTLEALRDPLAQRAYAVEQAGLSAAHLRALFARDVGLPMRSFALWRRLLLGVGACASLDATGAAHYAGFADLAHFTRTTRRLLGHTPSSLRLGLLS